MQIAFLGTGNAFAPGRDWSCVLVNGTILLDAGPTVLANLKRLPADSAAVRHIFISHFHGDHCLGLPLLLLDLYFTSRTEAPLTLVGPPGIEGWLTELMRLTFPDVLPMGWPRPITFVEAADGVTRTEGGLTFTPVEMAHGNGALRAFGFRLHLPEGVLAYSGDSRMTEALFTLINGARVLILEATELPTSTYHLTPADIRTLLATAPADSRTFLTHLDTPGPGPWAALPVTIPDDMDLYTLEDPLPLQRGHR